VKTLKDDASQMDGIRFLQEAAIMAQFRHPNVVALCGVAQKSGKVCMHVRVYVCIHACVCAHKCVCVCVCMRVCMHACVRASYSHQCTQTYSY
jgi:serine/threonine protein kinase